MFNMKDKGSNDLEFIIEKLKKHIGVLELLTHSHEQEIKKLKEQLKDNIKFNN
jgi:chaperonin cofactor prefoldin